MKCQAVNALQWKHQQPWRKCCENTAAHCVHGIRLCGTHFNAAARGPLVIFCELQQLDPATLT